MSMCLAGAASEHHSTDHASRSACQIAHGLSIPCWARFVTWFEFNLSLRALLLLVRNAEKNAGSMVLDEWHMELF